MVARKDTGAILARGGAKDTSIAWCFTLIFCDLPVLTGSKEGLS